MIPDARNIGGGACFFQWQTLDPQVLKRLHTQRVKLDGSFKHHYRNGCTLNPCGNWNSTIQAHNTHQEELLAGVLTLCINSECLREDVISGYAIIPLSI